MYILLISLIPRAPWYRERVSVCRLFLNINYSVTSLNEAFIFFVGTSAYWYLLGSLKAVKYFFKWNFEKKGLYYYKYIAQLGNLEGCNYFNSEINARELN